jgi:hypothetical protein
MADDARISTALPSHPKTRKLQKRLGPSGCWSLVCLFLWTASNRWTGDLSGFSDEDIELASEWVGEGGVFVKTLVEVAFLDGEPGKYRIHDWQEHNPWAATRGMRVECAKKAAAIRWQSRSDAERMQVASEPDAERMRPLQKGNAHHPTQPNPKISSSELEGSSDQSTAPTRKETANQPSRESSLLAGLLKVEILRNSPTHKITQAQERQWGRTVDLMLRLDHRTPEQIAEVIRWAQHDDFWMTNILSMEKLRKQFDQLSLKMRANGGPAASAPLPSSYVSVAEQVRKERAREASQ